MKYIQLIVISLLIFFSSCDTNNNKIPSIIEIIDLDYKFSTSSLINFCNKNKIDPSNIFQWQNYWIIYIDQAKAIETTSKIGKQFPKLKITLFNKPFYNFNREKLTGEKPAKEWDHIIMTANLVNDTILQNEYMEYHRTQFEKWPEISKGFINADFQQLLVFRNGRQLMLVISIPKGKTLDELNPKTTENNPRVDDWNKIMAKYQEGIEDAPQGSTWVMFKNCPPTP